MATIFPSSPSVGDTYQGYEWNGTAWIIIGIDLTQDYALSSELTDALADTTGVHGITDTSTLVVTTDSRLSDSRTPTVHASSHASGGSDPVTLAISQVTGLQTALDGKVDDSQVLTDVPLGAVFTDTTTNETITLSGDVSGSGTSSIVVTVADDSHNHVISNVDGLQTALDAKAPLSSPALTDTPTAPTAVSGTNTTQIATTAFVQTATAALIDAAPATLDTLNELAAALGDDANFSTTVTNSIATKANATDLSDHESATTTVHGIADTSALETITGAQSKADAAETAANAYTDTAIASFEALPDQTGNSGEFLTTDGTNTSWAPVPPSSPVGGGSDEVFFENDQNVTISYAISTGKNAGTFGPVSIADGVTVTVPDGSTWVVV